MTKTHTNDNLTIVSLFPLQTVDAVFCMDRPVVFEVCLFKKSVCVVPHSVGQRTARSHDVDNLHMFVPLCLFISITQLKFDAKASPDAFTQVSVLL